MTKISVMEMSLIGFWVSLLDQKRGEIGEFFLKLFLFFFFQHFYYRRSIECDLDGVDSFRSFPKKKMFSLFGVAIVAAVRVDALGGCHSNLLLLLLKNIEN